MSIRKVLGQVGAVLAVAVLMGLTGCGGGGGGNPALVGRWDLVKGPTSGNPEAMELLKDGTGIVDGDGVTYKTESGRFYISGIGGASSYDYKVSGSKLTLTDDDGDTLKYLKKGHTLSESDVDLFLYGKNPVPKWSKENINIETPDSWCYDNDPSNCAKYGRLYTWEAANKACQSMGGKWRLPTREDWNNLVNYVEKGKGGGGKKLKATSGWNNNGNGTDDYGFSAMPGGYRNSDGTFKDVGNDGTWWSATESGSGEAYGRDMLYNHDRVREVTNGKSRGFPVRCIAD